MTSRSRFVTRSNPSLKTRAANIPALLPPITMVLFSGSLRTARALSVLPSSLYDLAHLTTQSMNHIADMELCLYLCLWAKSCGILQDDYRIQWVRHPIERTVMRETAMRAIVRLGAKSA
jgi:hypothetical protein